MAITCRYVAKSVTEGCCQHTSACTVPVYTMSSYVPTHVWTIKERCMALQDVLLCCAYKR